MEKKKKIAIVGIGDVYERFYRIALKKICSARPDHYEIYCADNTSIWTGEVKKRRERTRDEILSKENFKFVDVANRDPYRINTDNFEDWIRNQKFDFIVIATPDYDHVNSVISWLEADCETFIVEKPFSHESNEIDKLFLHITEKKFESKKVIAYSHYRGKVHSQLGNKEFMDALNDELGSPLKSFRFFCLEDFSGTHEFHLWREQEQGYLIEPKRNGPIEIPGRQKALRGGMIFDLGSHMFPILEYFGKPASLDIEKIWAAKYAGVDFDDKSYAEINGETFARLDFSFEGSGGQNVFGQAYLGKGIRGIENPNNFELYLNQPEEGEVKFFELGAESGKKIQIFFKRTRESDKENLMRIITPGKEPEERNFLIEDAYIYLLKQALSPSKEQNRLFLTTQTAKSYLDKIEEIKRKIDGEINKLPTHFLGKLNDNGKITKYPDYLDDIMTRLESEPFWKKS